MNLEHRWAMKEDCPFRDPDQYMEIRKWQRRQSWGNQAQDATFNVCKQTIELKENPGEAE